MKRRDVEILQQDGLFLAHLAKEPIPLPLAKIARESGFRLPFLCDRVGVSERHLRRIFDQGLGISPKDWLRQERMVAARALLREGSSIKDVALSLGFANHKVMSREFHHFHGVTPSEFQRKERSYGPRVAAGV